MRIFCLAILSGRKGQILDEIYLYVEQAQIVYYDQIQHLQNRRNAEKMTAEKGEK